MNTVQEIKQNLIRIGKNRNTWGSYLLDSLVPLSPRTIISLTYSHENKSAYLFLVKQIYTQNKTLVIDIGESFIRKGEYSNKKNSNIVIEKTIESVFKTIIREKENYDNVVVLNTDLLTTERDLFDIECSARTNSSSYKQELFTSWISKFNGVRTDSDATIVFCSQVRDAVNPIGRVSPMGVMPSFLHSLVDLATNYRIQINKTSFNDKFLLFKMKKIGDNPNNDTIEFFCRTDFSFDIVNELIRLMQNTHIIDRHIYKGIISLGYNNRPEVLSYGDQVNSLILQELLQDPVNRERVKIMLDEIDLSSISSKINSID